MMRNTGKSILKRIYQQNLSVSDSIKYGENLLNYLYPGMNREDIASMLYETWSRRYIFEDFTHFKEGPFSGRYVNVDWNGFRNSKNQGPWPPNKGKNFSIFFIGGSSAFGYGVQDSETVSSYLQEQFSRSGLKKDTFVYNFGRGHYYSTQERILFEQLVANGYIPDMAIFLDGLNEFFYYKENGTAVSSRFEMLLLGDVHKLYLKVLRKKSPVLRTLRDMRKKIKRFFSADIGAKRRMRTVADSTRLTQLINRYMTNKKLIEAVGASFNVTTVFAWQPVPGYRYDLAFHPFAKGGFGRHEYSRSGYPLMEEYVKRNNLGNNFIWCADIGQDATKPLYIDIAHYSPRMSEMLAQTIYDFLVARCLIPFNKLEK